MRSNLTCVTVLLMLAGCASSGDRPGTTGMGDARGDAASAPAGVPAMTVGFNPCLEGLPQQGMWKCDPAFGDVNGDGHVDLAAIPRLGPGPRVWLGDGRGSWRDSSEGLEPDRDSCGGGVCFGDVNGDGHLDLAVADHCAGAFIYLGNGQGGWEMAMQSLNPRDLEPTDSEVEAYLGAEDLDLGDVNGDGHLDMLVGGSDDGGVNLYIGDGTGRNWTRVPGDLPETGWANRVRLVDMNGDGRLDAVATHNTGPRVWLNQADDTWAMASDGLPVTDQYQGIFHGLDIADINKDGRLDIAAANWVDGPEVHLQQADGSWRKAPVVFDQMEGGAVGVALGDLDNDGNMDMFVSGRLKGGSEGAGLSRGVFAVMGDGNGNWRYVSNSGLPATGMLANAGVALADVNGDGTLDAAVGSGLIVESAPGPREPVLPAHLLVWCGVQKTPASGPLAGVEESDSP